MAKWLKKVLGAAAVGTAAAGALYYWKKTKVDTEEFEDDFEDDDFDLDDDLKPVADREYVSLNKSAKETAEAAAGEVTEDIKEAAKEVAEDVKEAAKDVAKDAKEAAKDVVEDAKKDTKDK